MTKTTKSKHEWKREENGWRDLTSGLLWYDQKFSEGKYTYDEAMNKFGHTVPTKEEWEMAETHGIREVLDLNNDWYWSASVNSLNRNNSWFFSGTFGNVNTFSRNLNIWARCVGR